ncbi:MAG: tetratricopeptide repeat protein [Anaerolineae bacterium]|nr:tetratricopeptide repeat protein [Anaerolineae bacterium]
MDEAQTLFRQGVMALREQKDVAEGRRLLTESLKLDSHNEMAWLWLSRTTNDPQKRMMCINRALKINPNNEQALALKQKYDGAQPAIAEDPITDDTPDSAPAALDGHAPDKRQEIRLHLKIADQLLEKEDVEGAIEKWVQVLEIEVDHEEAMRNAVRHLSRLKYMDDAKELVWRAIQSGTQHPSIYLTAIDIARYNRDTGEEDELLERMVQLPDIDDTVIADTVDRFFQSDQWTRAEDVLKAALETHPDSQKLLRRMGDLYEATGRKSDAMLYYDRAARLGAGTREGREADKKLAETPAVLTDRERGSMALAWREAAGFGVFYLLLAWHDAGLNLLSLGINRWAGVAISILGGYLLVTATSSPQQQPLAQLLGGEVPENPPETDKETPAYEEDSATKVGLIIEPTTLPIIPPLFRLLFAIGGLVLLGLAIWLVFGTAINLLLNPVTPPDLPSIYDYLE